MTWANNKLHCRLVYRHAYSECGLEFGVLLISLMKKANIYIFAGLWTALNYSNFIIFSLQNLCLPGFEQFQRNFHRNFPVKTQRNTPFVQLVAFQWIFCTNLCDSLDFALISFKLFKFNSRYVHEAIKYFASLKSMMVKSDFFNNFDDLEILTRIRHGASGFNTCRGLKAKPAYNGIL